MIPFKRQCCLFFAVFLFAVCAQEALAIRLETKNGKAFEGKIVNDRNRYVRLKTANGHIYKIFKNQLTDDSKAVLAGEKPDLTPGINDLSEKTPHTLQNWRKWKEYNRRFLDRMKIMRKHFRHLMTDNAEQFWEVLRLREEKDPKKREALEKINDMEIARDAVRQIRTFQDMSSQLFSNNAFLTAYKRELMKAYERETKAMYAWLYLDVYGYHRLHKQAIEKYIEAIKYLLAVHRYMGAPPFVTGELETVLQRMNALLEENYH